MKLHRGSLKLAGLYLAILLSISLFFSATLYQTSIGELERGLRRPTPVLDNPIGPGFSEGIRRQIIDERQQQYNEARRNIINKLLITNLLILIGGGALSYYLALRTLRPIEEAHEAQSRFTADASHELRTPITSMRTENEVALMDPKLSLKEAKQQLQSNIEELEKLTSLVEGLLRFAQIDNAKLQTTTISADSIVTLAVDRALPRAEKRGILITTKITAKNAVISGDQVALTEALLTIIDNAVKYSPEKSEVTVTLSRQQKNIVFTVKDKGAGIKASELPHIFERFYRADSSRTKQHVDGYGLGLAIAKSIVDAHRGQLTATSVLNKGSTFVMTVPAAKSASA